MFTSTITAQPDSPSSPVGGPGIKVECEAQPIVIKNASGEKKFKIVVGLDFNIKGLQAKPQYPPYEWEIGDGDRFVFKSFWPFSPNIDKLSATATIPTFASLVNNSDLGSEHGIVRLTDSDNHSTLSTDPAPNANKKVQVFFQKDEPNYWNPAETNCLYYWKQFVDKKLIKVLNYEENINTKCKGSDRACTSIPLNYPKTDAISFFGQKCSESVSWVPKNKGIHHFIEVIEHENMHIQIFKSLWPNGYIPDLDLDYDFYPGEFEIQESAKGKYLFTISLPKIGQDPSIDAYSYEFAYPKGKWSVGKQYEEDLCNEAQINAKVEDHDYKDWSFDKINLYQRKNWIKQ